MCYPTHTAHIPRYHWTLLLWPPHHKHLWPHHHSHHLQRKLCIHFPLLFEDSITMLSIASEKNSSRPLTLVFSHLSCVADLCPYAGDIHYASFWDTCSTHGAHYHGLYIPIDPSCSQACFMHCWSPGDRHLYFGWPTEIIAQRTLGSFIDFCNNSYEINF